MLKLSFAFCLLAMLAGACKTTSQSSKTKSVQFSANGRPFLLYKDGLEIKLDLCSNVPDKSSLANAKAGCAPTKTYTKKMSEFLNLMANSFNTATIPGLSVVIADQKTVLLADVKKLEADLSELDQSIEFLEVAYSDTADAELVATINELKKSRSEIQVKLDSLKARINVIDTQTDQERKEEDLLTSLKELNQPIEAANKLQSAIISLVFSQERHMTLRDDPKKDSAFRYTILEVFGIPEYYCADGYQVRDNECRIKSCGTVDGAERNFGATWNTGVSNGTGSYRCTDLAVVELVDVTCNGGYDKVNKACQPKTCGDHPSGSTWTSETPSSNYSHSCNLGAVSTSESCKGGYTNYGQGCVPTNCPGHDHGTSWTEPYYQGTRTMFCSHGNISPGGYKCNSGWRYETLCQERFYCGTHKNAARYSGDTWFTGTLCTGIVRYLCDDAGLVRETAREPREACDNMGRPK